MASDTIPNAWQDYGFASDWRVYIADDTQGDPQCSTFPSKGVILRT